ncbi:ATP-binding protein [Natronococcus wangiae]|uniref:ATP-binding protein n=1 Tax=Natronococcus wangiae TaxID=3068275 RepID=UPI00273FFB87|nr:ATP-binding protein [Natronococcus sp. AD5]
MVRWDRLASAIEGWRIVAVLGGLYVALAVGWAFVQLSEDKLLSSILVVSLFIGVPGVVLLYGGYRLPRTDVRPEFYPMVVGWCFAGLGLMLGSLALYQFEPGESISDPSRAALVFTAFGSAAGFGIGLYGGQAKTRALEIELRNRKLQQTEAELEKTVNRLEELNDELAASNERLEQFAYAASHDLQEPLRMIRSYLTLIENRYGDAFDEDGEEFLEFAVDGADRMSDMIDGLLAYSRVDTRGEPFEPVDLDDVLEDARSDLLIRIEEADAEITAESLPRVEGDVSQLRQLFQNLLGNAITYSGDEPPRVYVTAQQRGEEWRISVRDEGVGIDPADADRIFEMFQRLHDHDEESGTGIGLALCKRIVERHGGEIRVDSEPGEGSTFSFTLPAVAESGS